MSNLREAAQQALNALAGYRREMNLVRGESYMHGQPCDAEIALRAALAKSERKRRTVKKRLTDDGWKKTREICS